MFSRRDDSAAHNALAQAAAISESQAVIEFNMDGTIITANENFLKALGYSLPEIKASTTACLSRPPSATASPIASSGPSSIAVSIRRRSTSASARAARKIWILASYNPVLDERKKPFKVVKVATDVTDQKLNSADFAGHIDAIGKSQTVIEFNMDGTIGTANANFLDALGYSLGENHGQAPQPVCGGVGT